MPIPASNTPMMPRLPATEAATRAEDKLSKRIEEHLAQPHFKTAHWGFLFVDLKSGEVVLERSSEKLFVPASTTKLFSTAAALDAPFKKGGENLFDAVGQDQFSSTPFGARCFMKPNM